MRTNLFKLFRASVSDSELLSNTRDDNGASQARELAIPQAPQDPPFDHVYKPSQLDDFVRFCDDMGGWGAPTVEIFGDGITAHTKFKIDLGFSDYAEQDPFSDAYFDRQMEVYAAVSGKSFDQSCNEMLQVDIDQYVNSPTLRSGDLSLIAHHVSTVAAALQAASLRSGVKILDIGCGVGLSCEVMASCGAQVTAVDINPLYIEIVNRRAARLGLPIKAYCSNILDYVASAPSGELDVIFFFESLHHIPRPWDLIQKLSVLLKPTGRFIVAGEPISFPSFQRWWPDWGVRLSAEDVYVARKYGWFETGFSEDFLRQMFARAGYFMNTARLDPGIVGGGRIDVAARC